MIVIPLLMALLLSAAPQDSGSAGAPHGSSSVGGAATVPPAFTPEQLEQIKQKTEQMRGAHEPIRQTAIRINDQAGNIHSEADARKLVDDVAEQLTHHKHLFWAGQKYRHRVAHAEYEAVSDPAGLIPEQRIVEVWNEYVREIDAPEEALITVAELHSLRRGDYLMITRYSWKHELSQSIWTMPNIYAVDANGEIADGCRALEALKILHDMDENFANVRFARERVQKGISVPDVGQAPSQPAVPGTERAQWVASSHLALASVYQNPIRPAVFRYQHEHGSHAYDQLIGRLFDELFPAE